MSSNDFYTIFPDALLNYVYKYYYHLSDENESERIALRAKRWRYRDGTIVYFDGKHEITDPAVLDLLKLNKAELEERIVRRILANHADKIVLVYCPRCQAQTRTPTARQCPKCFYSWHEQALADSC